MKILPYAGTGRVTRVLLPVYPRASYTLVDMSQERLDLAAAHIQDICERGAGRLCDAESQIEYKRATLEIHAEVRSIPNYFPMFDHPRADIKFDFDPCPNC